MRKIIVLFTILSAISLVSSGAPPEARTQYIGGGVPVAAETTAYCTGNGTCTGTNPGACELMCEDFDTLTTSCFSGYEAYCTATFGALGVSSGDTITFAGTAANTYACAGTTNTRVAVITVTADTHETYFRKSWTELSGTNVLYFQMYVNLTDETFANEGYGGMVDIRSGGGDRLFYLRFYQTSGGVNSLAVKYYNSSAATAYKYSSTQFTLDTWHRINIMIDSAGGSATVKVDGVTDTALNVSDLITTRFAGRAYFGEYDYNTNAYSFQLDNIAISKVAEPGACLN